MKVIQFYIFLLCTLTSSLTFAQLKIVSNGKIETFNISTESQVESIGRKCQIFESEDGTSLSLVSSIYGFGESALLKNASSATSGRLILNDRGDYDFLPKRDTRNVNSLIPGCSIETEPEPETDSSCDSFVENCEPCNEESRLDLVIIITQEFIPYIEGRGWNVEGYLNSVLAELSLTFSNLGINGMLNVSFVYADFPMSEDAKQSVTHALEWSQDTDGEIYNLVDTYGYDRALVLTPVFPQTADGLAEGYASSCEVPTPSNYSAVIAGDAITQGQYITSHELGHILGARHGFYLDADNDEDGCPGADRYFDPAGPCNSEPDCPVYRESIMTGSQLPTSQHPDWGVIPEFSQGEEYQFRNNAGTIASEWCNVSSFNELNQLGIFLNDFELTLIEDSGCGWLITFQYFDCNLEETTLDVVQHQANSQPPVATTGNVLDFECNPDTEQFTLQIDSDGNCTPQALTFSAVYIYEGETFSEDFTISLPSLGCDNCEISSTPFFITEDPEDCDSDVRVYSTPVPQDYYTEIYIKYAGSNIWEFIPEGYLIVTDCLFSVKVITKEITSQMEVSFSEVTGLYLSQFRNKKCLRRLCHEPQNDDDVSRVGGKLNYPEVVSFASYERSIVANLRSYSLEDDDFVVVSDILGREVFKGAFSQILPDQFLYSSGKILFVKILKK